LAIVGYHRFRGANWAQVLKGGGYTFRRPWPDQADKAAKQIDEIEAKPRGVKEPRLKDALHTVKVYLAGKPEVDVFEWPHKVRAPARRSWPHWQEDDGFEHFDDGYEDGE
jgi:hypothetical protein